MAIDFPNSPTVNQSFTAGGSTWIWDGIAWTLQRITTGATGPQGDVGPQGPTGATGPQGTSINVKASVATVALLPSSGNSANDARVVDADGDLYIWSGSSWSSAGQIVGPQGPTGLSGTAATISVASTTTLAAGSAASVTNTGTTSAATLSFGIPQGPIGLTGLTGPAGETFPTQTGNAGKYLSTNGTSTSWATVTTTPAAGSITNAMLANSSISINSSPVALGANINLATTAYSNGTNTANSNKIFYNSSGVQPTGTAAGDLYIFF